MTRLLVFMVTLALCACGSRTAQTPADGGRKPDAPLLPDDGAPDRAVPDAPVTPPVGWAVAAGGDKSDWGWDVVVDSAGNAWVTGHFQGQARFGPHVLQSKGWSNDMFLAKLSPEGQFQWAVSAGGPADDKGLSLVLLPGGDVAVCGLFSSTATFGDGSITLTSKGMTDTFVARYGADGTIKWVRQASSPGSDWGWRLAADDQGGLFLTGKHNGPATLGTLSLPATGQDEAYTAHLDGQGTFDWASNAGWYGAEAGYGVAAAGNGSAIATGRFEWTVDFGPVTLSAAGDDDVYVVKYGPGGKVQWARSAGGNGADTGWAAAPDGAGGAYLTGSFTGLGHFGMTTLDSKGASDLFVARYSAAGELMWAAAAGGAKVDRGHDVVADGAGVLVTGYFTDQASFGAQQLVAQGDQDLFVARLDSAGSWDWAQAAGGPGLEHPWGLAPGPGRTLYVTGSFEESMTLGGNPLTSAGGDDIFVWKMVLP